MIELLTDIQIELRNMLSEQKRSNERLEKLEIQQEKTNLALGELRLSVMKLADNIEVVFQHEKRITKLEEAVFH